MRDVTKGRTLENPTYESSKLNEYVENVLQLEAVACKP